MTTFQRRAALPGIVTVRIPDTAPISPSAVPTTAGDRDVNGARPTGHRGPRQQLGELNSTASYSGRPGRVAQQQLSIRATAWGVFLGPTESAKPHTRST